jgi:hypothetical protein
MTAEIDRRHDRPVLRAWRISVLSLLVLLVALLSFAYWRLASEVRILRTDTAQIRVEYLSLRQYLKESAELRNDLEALRKQVQETREHAQQKFGRER